MHTSDTADTATQSTEVATPRRRFLGLAALAAAAPIVNEAMLAHAAQAAAVDTPSPKGMALHGQGFTPPPSDAVLINANENPLGPSKTALEAIYKIAPSGGRYDIHGETEALARTFAEQHGLKRNYVAVYTGSSEPLHYSVLAFTSANKGLVIADPTYEAPMAAASVSRAKLTKVPLTAAYTHDVKAMVAADPSAGVIYICNPNNPTGTITPKADIAWALENKPKGSILLVDEAYLHLSNEPDVLDLVAQDKDLIVLRTFSKIYGMAGLRCGFAVGRPDLLAKLQAFGWNAMPITGSAAAHASIIDPNLVPERRKIIGDTRRSTIAWLTSNGYKVIGDPQTNCFMIDTGRPGRQVMSAMAKQKVMIGRTWPIWPNAVRITVGTPEEMAKFQLAFQTVMSTPAVAFNALDHAPERLTFPHYS